MTKVEIKRAAQHELLTAVQIAFTAINDAPWGDNKSAMLAEASVQLERIEKLFGYTPGSWGRGC